MLVTGAFLLSPFADLMAGLQKRDVLVTPLAGYSSVKGPFEEQLNKGFMAGLSFRYMILDNIYAGAGLRYSIWDLKYSEESTMRSYGFLAGGGIVYGVSLFSYTMYPFAGLFYQESLMYLDTDRLGEKERTYKPGAVFRAGIELPVVDMVYLQLSGEYSVMPLSDREFETVQWTAGVTYNHSAFTRWNISRKEMDQGKIEMLLSRGINEFEAGRIDSAHRYFSRVMSLDPGHPEAEEYLEKISSIKTRFNQARELSSEEQYYRALKILDSIRKNHNGAAELIEEIRSRVAGDVPGLVEEGIAAYKSKQYEKCIDIMDRVLVYDPDNRLARIYYTRAQKRREALEKLR